MPLYKRTPFALLEPPIGLNLNEAVFQVRFTKEIFREYQDYINRLNLYRQRVWTCKATWKSNLTFEEALVSEHRAAEKFQQIPEGYLVPILQMVQYSTLTLKDLTDTIIARLQGYVFEDMELHGMKDQLVCPCKILKIENSKSTLVVGWLNRNKAVVDTSTITVDSLIWKKLPIKRSMLKSFIRDSTFRSAPWVVHEKLAVKYGIKMSPPEELRDMINGHVKNKTSYLLKAAECQKINRKNKHMGSDDVPRKKKIKVLDIEERKAEEPIKYPIDDLLVKPGADDPVLADRPLPTRDFMIPVDCVGDLLMVWDFCSSFGRILKLWPFSLDDFEKALCHRDGSLVMIVETHSSLLNVLIKDEGEYSIGMANKRKSKITLRNWIEYLCDFLEFKKDPELLSHVSIIKRGHYSLLDVASKLKMLHEIVNDVLMTASIRNKLDEFIKRKQNLAAAQRDVPQLQKEASNANNEECTSHETNKGNILASNGANIDNHKGGGDQVEHNGDRSCGDENILQTDGGHKAQDVLDGKLKVYSRKSPETLHENGTILETEGPSEIVETQKKKHITKEKDGQGQGKKSDEQRKRNLAREKQEQFLRTNMLGKDRDYNRYWFFRRDGRLLVESPDSKQWGFYTTKEELDMFMASLNPKGVRERSLQRQLSKHYNRISSIMQKRSQEVAQRVLLEEAVLRRSTRVRAPPRDNPAMAFLRYTNKWRED